MKFYRITGEKFNIFQVLNVEEKERFICRVLIELLSPSGTHNQGSLFLRQFVKKVLGLHDIPDDELINAKVSCEYSPENFRVAFELKNVLPSALEYIGFHT